MRRGERMARVVALSPSDAHARALSAWTGLVLAIATLTILVAGVTVVAMVLRLRGGGLTGSYATLPAMASLFSMWSAATFEASRARVRGNTLPAWRGWTVGVVTVLLLLPALGAPSAGLVAWPAWVLALSVGVFIAALLLRASWDVRPTWRGPRGELLAFLGAATLCTALAVMCWGGVALRIWIVEGPLGAAWIVAATLQGLLAATSAGVAILLWSRAFRHQTGRLYLGVPVGSAWAHAQVALSVLVSLVLFFF